ncbi:hypothetical protein [Palaeococcus sp. (in: euryarchaeotes)]
MALGEGGLLNDLRSEMEKDVGLLIEPVSMEEFLNFVEELRLELIGIVAELGGLS